MEDAGNALSIDVEILDAIIFPLLRLSKKDELFLLLIIVE
jgi:hypothetical protein